MSNKEKDKKEFWEKLRKEKEVERDRLIKEVEKSTKKVK